MDSAQETLIAIASASQQVIDALVAYSRDRNDNIPRKQLGGDLQRIVVASKTLLTETLQHSPSAGSAVDDRLENWLSSKEPQTCLDTLQEMEALIQSSSSGVTSTLRNLFRSEDKFQQVIRIFQQRRVYFYFLLNTNIWNHETATVNHQGHSTNNLSTKQGFVDRNTNAVERSWKKKIWSEMDQTRLNEMLGWLDAWDCTEKQEDMLELRQPDTCTWLPDTDEYQTWRCGNDTFLWLHGKPGSGKSVLAASVIDSIQNTMGEGELLAVFYCDFRSGRSTVAAEVMRSLLSQLLQGLSDLGLEPGDVLDVIAKEKRQRRSILCSAKRLASLVCRCAEQFPQPPRVIVDALDECEDIENLLDSLLVLNENGVRLFVISRPLQMIKDKFSRLPWLSLEHMSKEVSADIRLHVKREVDSHRRFRIAGVRLKEEIINTLCSKADGMFRWIECQLKTLKRCFTTVDIRKVLDSLPIGLGATYEQILVAIRKEERGVAISQRVLVWLVTALEPLQLCQIVETLSIDVDRRTLNPDAAPIHGWALLDSLGSLVIHHEETDIVKLSHFSVKEYLVGSFAQENHIDHIDERDAHAQVARQCMSYISAYLKLGREGSSDEHPLLDYVFSRQSFGHLAYVEPTKSILDAVVALHSDIQQHSSKWRQLQVSLNAKHFNNLPQFPSPEDDFVLYILIRFAPEPLLRLFLSDAPLTHKDGVNPLVYAVPGKIEHARTLLSHGAKLHISARSMETYCYPGYGLPIEAAARARDRPLVDLFLEEGSPVPHQFFSAVLLEDMSALTSPHTLARLLQTDEFMEWAILISNEKLLTTLLVKHMYGQGWTESSGNVVTIVRRLKQIGCDLTGDPSFTEALLVNALRAGDISGIHYLLSDLNIQLPPDILLDQSLLWSQCPDAEMTRFLVRNGANIHSVSANESTVLHFSVQDLGGNICLDTTEVLYEAGCNPSACNLQGVTPMHIAANQMHLPVVKHLHSIGAFLPTDILFAAELVELEFYSIPTSLSSSMILFLLEKGADARVIAANGDNALHSTLRYRSPDDSFGRLESTRMLVAAGCDPNVTNSSGQTSLDVAVASGCIHVVKHLLSLNVPLSPHIFLTACGGSYEHSTHFLSMIRVLLNHGADPNMTMPNGDSAPCLPLALAVNCWQWKENSLQGVVKALVAVGCDPSARDTEGQTIFHIAAGRGYIKIIEYLLSRGTSLPPDILLRVHALSYMAITTQTISFLIHKGADVRAVSATGDTPLHCASFSGRELSRSLEFAKLLIAAGSDPCAFNEAHETPMHEAAAQGNIPVIDYLLSLGAPLPRDILLAPFLDSSHSGSLAITSPVVRFLIYKRADTTAVTAKGDTILHLAVAGHPESESDHLESTKILVEAGCNINACNPAGETPLHAAARSGYIDIIKYLLSQGATLPHDVFLAAARGEHRDFKAMEYLLSRGALVPPEALLAAADSEHWAKSQTVQFLATLLESADLCIVAPDGDTVLHRAVKSGSEEDCLKTAKLLVDLGCDPSSRNLAGETPLHISARQHHISVLKYLLSQGAPLPSNVLLFAASGNWLYTPTPVANLAMMRFLIREGANPCAVDDKGDTPLHILLRHDIGNRMPGWRAIQTLLDADANPYARNLNGQTPIDLAEQAGPFFVKNFMRLVKEANESNAHRHH